MQLSNLFISAIVSYISICDANYQVTKPQPTTVQPQPSYPTQAPSYPVKPPTTGNNDLYFVCKLNEIRQQRGLKPLAYVSNAKSITDKLVSQYATIGHQSNDLFGSFNDAKCSVSQYVEQYFSGFASIDAVSDSLTGNQEGFLFKNDYDTITFSFKDGYSSVVLAASDKCDVKVIPQCGAPQQPEQPSYPVENTPSYPTKEVEVPKPQPTKPSYPTKPVETPAPKPPAAGVSQEARKSLCLTNKFRVSNGLAPLMMSPTLCSTSVGQSITQDNRGSIGHDGENGKQLGDRLSDAGFKWAFAAENVAFNQHDVSDVQKSWENSPGHRENLLSDKATCFGYGQSKPSAPGNYYTQNFAAPANGQGDCYVDDYTDC